MKSEDSFRSNVTFAVISNLAIATVSALTTFILPKFLGVEEYGYWQLFVFYGSYVLLMQLGAADGVNLRYGGLREADLPVRGVGLQTVAVLIFTVLASTCFFLLATYFIRDEARLFVVQLTAVYSAIVNVRHFILLQMQATGSFRLFSRITIFDRVFFSMLVILLLINGADYWLLATAEIVSKAATLLFSVVAFRRVLVVDWSEGRAVFQELIRNIASGMKLTIANTSNMFILGIARLLIDRTFGVAVFGAISLVLNLSAFFMIFVKAIGVVLLPFLRRAQLRQLPKLYEMVRLPLSIIPLILLVAVYPMIVLFSSWLPEYQYGIKYLAILMPIIAFESKMSLLVEPYLKALRKENLLLSINLFSLAVSIVLGLLSSVVLMNLDLAVLSIVISLGLRTLLAEIVLLKILKLKISNYIAFELGLVFLSIFLNFVIGGWFGAVFMLVLVLSYIVILRTEILARCTSLFYLIRSK